MTTAYFDEYTNTCHGRTLEDNLRKFGGKGYNLRVMTNRLALPVPPGFTIGNREMLEWYHMSTWNRSDYMDNIVSDAMRRLNQIPSRYGLDRTFGGQKPLLVSVRSGARVSMPGMMDTILNVGLNDVTVEALAEMTNPEFAYDSYRRLLQMWATTVCGLPAAPFTSLHDSAVGFMHGERPNVRILRRLCDQYKTLIEDGGHRFPQKLEQQIRQAVTAVFTSWDSPRAKAYREIEKIPHLWGTTCTIQTMVFGNLNEQSGTGVVFTRNPINGDPKPYGDFMICAQGEDVVAGTSQTLPIAQMAETFPECYKQLSDIMVKLEEFYLDMQDIEFTIENGKLWILQCRSGKRAPKATVRIALDFLTEGKVTVEDTTNKIMKIIESAPAMAQTIYVDEDNLSKIGHGLGACDGTVVGKIAFTSERAIEMAKNGPVILVRDETAPDDIDGMQASVGILTMTGGLVSHAAVVARGWGKPCIVSASISGLYLETEEEGFDQTSLRFGDSDVNFFEGDVLKLVINDGQADVFAQMGDK